MSKLAAYPSIPVPRIDIITNASNTPEAIIMKLIGYSLFFIGALAFVFVIWGGILFVTSGGDAEKTTKARNTLLYAVIGIIVVVLAWVIVNWAAQSFAPNL